MRQEWAIIKKLIDRYQQLVELQSTDPNLKELRPEPDINRMLKKYHYETPENIEYTKPSRVAIAYDILHNLEKNIRNCIKEQLMNVDEKWWKNRIPDDVRNNAEIRLQADLKGRENSNNIHPIEFVDFPDYTKIIIRTGNWKSVFSKIFLDDRIIYAKLKELEPMRNRLAHSRDLSEQELNKLNLLAIDILSNIRRMK